MTFQAIAMFFALVAVILTIVAADRQSPQIMSTALALVVPAAVMMVLVSRKETKASIWKMLLTLILVGLAAATAETGFAAVALHSAYLLGVAGAIALVTLIFAFTQRKRSS